MNTIELRQVLPAVFADAPPAHSDVWHTDAAFYKGKAYLLEAVSGAGKSSLCGYLYGYRRDYTGAILFDGADVRDLTPRRWSEVRNTSIAMMFQDLRLFPELTAAENVQIKNNLTGHKTEEQIAVLFDALGIADKYDAPVGKLSFGQQQRVAFIRMLCQRADFMILDEPASHLDDRNAEVVARILSDEARAQGAGVIVTSIGRHFDLAYDKTMKL